jgi:hypothetical protein
MMDADKILTREVPLALKSMVCHMSRDVCVCVCGGIDIRAHVVEGHHSLKSLFLYHWTDCYFCPLA